MSDRTSPSWIADFDSASAMVQALAAHLDGRSFDALGLSRPVRAGARLATALPIRVRRHLYALSGRVEAVEPERLAGLRDEEVASWAAGLYPRRTYPGLAIGSSNGALLHLWARLGIPWLPQTYLVPVRHGDSDVDRPDLALGEGARLAAPFLRANPDLQLHQMHDANQDRLMIRYMMYFRIKRRRLGDVWRRFIAERVAPGGTVIVVDCRTAWSVTRVDHRHVFQHGGYGGATPSEYLAGGERVASFLSGQGSAARSWPSPSPDEEAPEAEWGFEPALIEDLADTCRRHRLRLVRLTFPEPETPSPWVADLHRAELPPEVPASLLVNSFILLDLNHVAAHAVAPFWCCFSVQPSLERVRRYLAERPAFDRVDVALFPHGADSIGLARPPDWSPLFASARRGGGFLGVDEARFPADFAAIARFTSALKRTRAARVRRPPMPVESLERLMTTLPSGASAATLV